MLRRNGSATEMSDSLMLCGVRSELVGKVLIGNCWGGGGKVAWG